MDARLVLHKIRLAYREGWKAPKIKATRILQEPVIDFSKTWGFFHGACQGTPGLCGAEAILFFNNHHYFTIIYGAGIGTNNRVEFLLFGF